MQQIKPECIKLLQAVVKQVLRCKNVLFSYKHWSHWSTAPDITKEQENSKNKLYFAVSELVLGAAGCQNAGLQCMTGDAVCSKGKCACEDHKVHKNDNCVPSKT